MKPYALECRQVVPATLREVWQFFSDPHNLGKITPASLNLVVPADLPHVIYPGMMITYRVRPFAGFVTTWVSEITHLLENKLFVDEQRLGPYRLWHHEHHFLEVPGGVEVRDLIHYMLPLGPMGRMAHALIVKKQLDRIFEYRKEVITRVFGA